MKISKKYLKKIIKEEYTLIEARVLHENKVEDAVKKLKAIHTWVMKPENEWIRKMALKMIGDKDLPEKEEVKDAKVQAESRNILYEEEEKSEGVMAAYKKLKAMYAWVMSDENNWAREVMVNMLKTGDEPDEKVISKKLKEHKIIQETYRKFCKKVLMRRLIQEANDQDYQNIIDNIVDKFYSKAKEFETYVPLSIEEITSEERDVVFNFHPPEFQNPDDMDSSAMLELSPEEILALEEFLFPPTW